MQQERTHSGATAKKQERLVQGITIGGLRMWNSACASINRGPAHANLKRGLAACTTCVELRCGAVALGRTYPLPPLSSGGALVVPPSLRFHIPLIGRVEDWRAGLARGPDPHHVARNVRISRIARPHLLHAKAYGTYPAGATFGPSRRTR